MSQVRSINTEPRDNKGGNVWKNLSAKLGLPFEKYASAAKEEKTAESELMMKNSSVTPIGLPKASEYRFVSAKAEIVIKPTTQHMSDIEDSLLHVMAALKYIDDDDFRKLGVRITEETKVKDIKSFMEASSALQEAKKMETEAEKELSALEPRLMGYFQESESATKLLEIEDGFIQLSEKPVKSTPSYKAVVDELKVLLKDYKDKIEEVLSKHTPPTGRTKSVIESHPTVGGFPIASTNKGMSRSALLPKEIEEIKYIWGSAMNDLIITGNLLEFLLNESIGASMSTEPMAPTMPGIETGIETAPETGFEGTIGEEHEALPIPPEMSPAMARVKEVMLRKSMRRKADGTQGTWDIEGYKNVDRCRDCVFFQSDPGGSHLNKCHKCIRYNAGGTVDLFQPRSQQEVVVTPSFYGKEPVETKKKEAYVGTLGIKKEAEFEGNTGFDEGDILYRIDDESNWEIISIHELDTVIEDVETGNQVTISNEELNTQFELKDVTHPLVPDLDPKEVVVHENWKQRASRIKNRNIKADDQSNLKLDVKLEDEAINTYEKHIEESPRTNVKGLLNHIESEEEQHKRELEEQLKGLDENVAASFAGTLGLKK